MKTPNFSLIQTIIKARGKEQGEISGGVTTRNYIHASFEARSDIDYELLNLYIDSLVNEGKLVIVVEHGVDYISLNDGPHHMFSVHPEKYDGLGKPTKFRLLEKTFEKDQVSAAREEGFAMSLNMAKKARKAQYRTTYNEMCELIDSVKLVGDNELKA